jgi:hypothetical protein
MSVSPLFETLAEALEWAVAEARIHPGSPVYVIQGQRGYAVGSWGFLNLQPDYRLVATVSRDNGVVVRNDDADLPL